MSEMVERVARAMVCAWEQGDPAYVDERWVDFEGAARAAIAAMREPTDAVLAAGPGDPYMDREVWGNMIDAALKDT